MANSGSALQCKLSAINCNNLFATFLNYPTFLLQLLRLVWVSAVIWHAGRLCPFLLSTHLCSPSSLPLPCSRCWPCLSFGHLFSLKDLGGWRGLWWKGLGGIFPVPVQKARAEWIIKMQNAHSILCDGEHNCRGSPSPTQTKTVLLNVCVLERYVCFKYPHLVNLVICT